jgi:hypothetical protein
MLYGLIWRTVKSERPEKPEKDAAIDPSQHASPSRDDMAAAKPRRGDRTLSRRRESMRQRSHRSQPARKPKQG